MDMLGDGLEMDVRGGKNCHIEKNNKKKKNVL